MGVFVKWYVGLLKTRPMIANMGSALVLMSAGDVMAQEIEFNKFGGPDNAAMETDKKAGYGSHLQQPQHQDQHEITVHLKRYGTRLNVHHDDQQEGQDNTNANHTSNDENKKRKFLATMMAKYSNNEFLDSISSVYEKVSSDIMMHANEIDYYRTGTMIGWSVCAYTPYYVGLYKLFERFLPKQTPTTVAVRVAICVLAAVPMNAAFFTYGTMVHHTSDWVAEVADFEEKQRLHQQQDEKGEITLPQWMNMVHLIKNHICQNTKNLCQNNNNETSPSQLPPYDLPLLLSTTQEKLHTELWTTCAASATAWIPINYLNFMYVPTHLRPVTLMVCSVFWNCYLSLAQHRDVTISDDCDH